MSTVALARRWTCAGCGVAIGRIDGQKVPIPGSWERGPEGDFCLSCRRGRAADAAQAAVAEDASAAARAKARRDGLLEFEVRRTPELADATIARACRTNAPAIAATRTRLRMESGPPSGADRSWTAARRRIPRQRA